MKRKRFTLDDYDITFEGLVINKHNGHILKPQPNNKGYLRIMVNKNRYFVHRLVAQKYVPNPNNNPQVNHKDGNKLNNNANNLEWVTNQQNRTHAVKNSLILVGDNCPWSKLDTEKVKFIREYCDKYSYNELAKMFNVSRSTIIDVVKYKNWKHVK